MRCILRLWGLWRWRGGLLGIKWVITMDILVMGGGKCDESVYIMEYQRVIYFTAIRSRSESESIQSNESTYRPCISLTSLELSFSLTQSSILAATSPTSRS